MRLKATSVVIAAAAVMSMLTFAPGASASTATAPAETVVETKTESLDARTCTRLRVELGRDADCSTIQETTVGPVEVSTGLLEAQSSKTQFSTQDIQAMSAGGTIYCRNWSMQRRPRDGSRLWQISQRGRHCWDGSVAWYGTYRGVAGYHECGYDDYGIFSVRSRSCTRSGNVTTQLRNSYAVTFQIPRTTLYSTFTLAYYGQRNGSYSTSGL